MSRRGELVLVLFLVSVIIFPVFKYAWNKIFNIKQEQAWAWYPDYVFGVFVGYLLSRIIHV